jgi:pimeloyl-ACP methyl ester carboxylesterase
MGAEESEWSVRPRGRDRLRPSQEHRPEAAVAGGVFAGWARDSFNGKLQAVSDVILIDQRGIGLSSPNMQCPEGPPPPPDVFAKEEAFQDALIACVRRLLTREARRPGVVHPSGQRG